MRSAPSSCHKKNCTSANRPPRDTVIWLKLPFPFLLNPELHPTLTVSYLEAITSISHLC